MLSSWRPRNPRTLHDPRSSPRRCEAAPQRPSAGWTFPTHSAPYHTTFSRNGSSTSLYLSSSSHHLSRHFHSSDAPRPRAILVCTPLGIAAKAAIQVWKSDKYEQGDDKDEKNEQKGIREVKTLSRSTT
jgi:hypothetical protein